MCNSSITLIAQFFILFKIYARCETPHWGEKAVKGLLVSVSDVPGPAFSETQEQNQVYLGLLMSCFCSFVKLNPCSGWLFGVSSVL